jgi:TP901 family phage tail tape measure protein
MADYVLSASLTADADKFNAAVRSALDELKTLKDKTAGIGDTLKNNGKNIVTAGAAITAGVTVPFVAAVKTTGDFESAMSKAGTIAGASASELDAMKQAALEMGSTTSLSSSQVADAMSNMAAKGFDANQVIASMPGVISAAEASGEDLSLVADTVTSALNGFGLEASESGRVADILAMSANKTAAGVGDLGYAFKYAAPVASSLGIGLEELAAATGIMADSGLEGSQAGTTLRAVMTNLASPTDEARAAMEAMGFSAINADGSFKPLNQIIGDLNGSMAGMTDAQKLATLSTLVGTEVASGMLVLLDAGQEGIAGMTTELQNSEGASAEAAASMKDNMNGALDNLSGAVESATISLMSTLTPTIAAIADKVTGLVEKFNALPESTKGFLAISAAVVAISGPILAVLGVIVMGIGSLITSVGTIGAAFAAAGGFSGVFASALAAITGPVGLVVAGIAALVGILIYGWQTSETFRNAVTSAVTQIWGSLQGLFTAVMGFIAPIMPVVTTIITGILDLVVSLIAQVISVVGPILSFIIDIMTGIIGAITPIAVVVGEVLAAAWGIFSDVFSTILSYTGEIFAGIVEIINALSPVVGGVFNTIGDIVSTVMGVVSDVISGTFENIKGAWEGLKGFVSGVFDGVASAVESLVGEVRGFVNGVIGGINGAISIINKIPGVSIGSIPFLVNGTNNWQGGFAMMNEGGRGELVNLPNGSQVIPHDVSMKYAKEAARNTVGESEGGSGVYDEGDVNITIDRFENNTDRDLETLAYNLAWMTKKERGRLSAY